MKVWSGAAWAEKPTKAWSGSAWVAKPVKVWSGTAWVTKPAAGGPTGPTTTMVGYFVPGTPRDDFAGEVGYMFRPTANITASWMGIYVMAGNTGFQPAKLYQWFDQSLLRTASIDVAGKVAGEWAWSSIAPITLTAGVDYVLVKPITIGSGQVWSDQVSTYIPACTNVKSVYRDTGAFNPVATDWTYVGLDLGW